MEKECKYHGLTRYNKKNKCSKCSVESVQIHRWKRKNKAIEYKGGKCSKCGYDKCSSALEFHHEDEKEKEYNISTASIEWDLLRQELDKCILVCANCHREIHHKQNELMKVSLLERQNLKEMSQIKLKNQKKKCIKCDKNFQPKKNRQIFCSKECTRKKIRPSKEILIKELENSNYTQLGKKYGVSDNAIRKWIK